MGYFIPSVFLFKFCFSCLKHKNQYYLLISAIIFAVYAAGDARGMFDYDGIFLGRDASPDAYRRSLVQKVVSYTY